MSAFSELFWKSSLEELKKGYILDKKDDDYICLICGEKYSNGQVYEIKGLLYEARKAIESHIIEEHGCVFDFLISLDKRYTSLTDHQKELFQLYYQGQSDKEIAEKVGGSTSTYRNHRFSFREKEKQAKVFLAIAELLREENGGKKDKAKLPSKDELIDFPRSVRMVDERFAFTREEYEKTIAKYFPAGPEGPLSEFPHKEKRKVIILTKLADRFEKNREYGEKEINEILKDIYPDYAVLRRYLVDYGFLDRIPDGSSYWLIK